MPKESIPLSFGLPSKEKHALNLEEKNTENLKKDFYHSLRDGNWGHCQYILKHNPELKDVFINPYDNKGLIAAKQGFIQALRHEDNFTDALKIQEAFELFDSQFLQSSEVQKEVKGAILYAVQNGRLRQAKQLIEACEVSQESLPEIRKEILISLLKQDGNTEYDMKKEIEEFDILVDPQDKQLQNLFNEWVINSPVDGSNKSLLSGFEKYKLLGQYNIPLSDKTRNHLKSSFIELVDNFRYANGLYSLIDETQKIVQRFLIIKNFLTDDFVLERIRDSVQNEIIEYLKEEIGRVQRDTGKSFRSLFNIDKIFQARDLFQLPRDFLKNKGQIFLTFIDYRMINFEDLIKLIENFDISLEGLNIDSFKAWLHKEVSKKLSGIESNLNDLTLTLDRVKLLKNWQVDIFEGIQINPPDLSALINNTSQNYEILEQKWKVYQEILEDKIPDFSSELEKIKDQLIKEGRYEFILSKIEIFYPNVATPKDIYVILPQLKDEIKQQPEKAKEIFEYVLQVFGYNHLPYLGKSLLVFKKIFPLSALKSKIKSSKASPELQEILESEQPENCYDMFFNDLWRAQIESGTPDLQEYIIEFIRGKNSLKKEITNPSSLSLKEQSELDALKKRLAILIFESKSKDKKQKDRQNQEKYKSYPANKLLRLMRVLEKGYAKKAGCNSAEELLQLIQKYKKESSIRRQGLAEEIQAKGIEAVSAEKGFLIKQIKSDYLNWNLENGFPSKEFLAGNYEKSDSTPFDVDFLLNNPEAEKNITFAERYKALYKKIKSYGDMSAIIFNRGQFNLTRDSSEYPCAFQKGAGDNQNKYELFYSGVVKEQHYGVRSGIPSSEFDLFVLPTDFQKEKLEQIKQIIVSYGSYYPVIDSTGQLLFSLYDYESITRKENLYVNKDFENFHQEWTEISPPAGKTGSAESAFFERYLEDKKEQVICKFYPQPRQAINEHFYCLFYKALGIAVPETGVGKVKNRVAFISKLLEGAELRPQDSQVAEQSQRAIPAMLTANWDIPKHDNTLFVGDIPYWVDNGGAGYFRARGKLKGQEGSDPFYPNKIIELETMKKHYPDLTDEKMKSQAFDLLKNISPIRLKFLYQTSGLAEIEHQDKVPLSTEQVLLSRMRILAEKFDLEPPHDANTLEEFVLTLCLGDLKNNEWLRRNLEEWTQIDDEKKGYQHNQVLLRKHTETVLQQIKADENFKKIDERDQNILFLAGFFHDIGKPVGEKGQALRDYQHGEKSIMIFKKHIEQFEISPEDADDIIFLIENDETVTNGIRKKELHISKEDIIKLCGTLRRAKLLSIFNKSDAIAALTNTHGDDPQKGIEAFKGVQSDYEKLFNEAFKQLEVASV